MKKLILFSMALFFSVAVFSQRNDNSEYWNVWEEGGAVFLHDEYDRFSYPSISVDHESPYDFLPKRIRCSSKQIFL